MRFNDESEPQAKRQRVTKTKSVKPTIPARKGRKPKEGQDKYDAEQVARETRIAADSPLFNSIMNPYCILQSTAEEFLESFDQTPGVALADLINLFLRSCGSNESLNSDEVLDYDGIVDSLDNYSEALKQENIPIHPLTSKLPIFKKFRKSLSEFLNRVVDSAAELGVLYSSNLMETLQAWVIAMSSSHIRSFRHTATVVALEVETSLCDVAAAVGKEAEIVGRQREGEKKRKGTDKGNAPRIKELEAKGKNIRERRIKLDEFLKEFVDGVFVHRYRDFDPTIRAECVHAIGTWFKKYPEHFLDVSYLRYIGWVLSDSDTHVRLEAVKSLSGVYEQAEYINSLSHFTERFKPRLMEMATSDTELSIRVSVLQVLSVVDSRSLLEDEERERLCLLVFDQETRVRKAVSRFIKSVWEDQIEERLLGKTRSSEEDQKRTGSKALALLLVRWGVTLDEASQRPEDGPMPEESSAAERETSQIQTKRELTALVKMDQKSRLAYAVEALWDEVDVLRDWKVLLDMLLLDHSFSDGTKIGTTSSRGKRKSSKKANNLGNVVDDSWRLNEAEESVLLEVFVAVLRKAQAEPLGHKKGSEDDFANDSTRELIKVLPQLFIKHQTDQNRISNVLIIPTLMNLDLYLEMRMVTSYEHLWDDVMKQFLSHTSSNVLIHAIGAICHLIGTTSLSNANSSKMLELEDELSSNLRDAIAGREEIELASFTEDEVLSLTAVCTRMAILCGSRNMVSWLEEDEGGKQSSGWDILSALVDRGRLGYREEALMVEQALNVLTLHIMWKARGLLANAEPIAEDTRFKDSLLSQREPLLEKLLEYAIGTQSNTINTVKRTAFKHLLNLHVMFATRHTVGANGVPIATAFVPLFLDEQTQFRCAGYILAEIEQYAELLGGEDNVEGYSTGEDTDAELHDAPPQRQKKTVKHSQREVDLESRSYLENEYIFMDLISTFLRAIRAGAIHIEHSVVLLTHHGRLGSTFDVFCKAVVDLLKEEGLVKDHGEVIVPILVQALRSACQLVLDGIVSDETKAIHLSKLLSSCFVMRGSQLSIIRRLSSQYIVQLHSELLSWIVQRLSAYESNKNNKYFKSTILFFRVLIPLVANITNRDALQIKAHIDQILAEGKVEALATSKNWEPYRAYEKRLIKVIAKDKKAGRKGKGKEAELVAATTTDDEVSDLGGATDEGTKQRTQELPNDIPSPTGDADDMPQDVQAAELTPATPRSKSRPKPIYKSTLPISSPGDKEQSPEEEGMDAIVDFRVNSPQVSDEQRTNGFEQTPQASRKRRRNGKDQLSSKVEGSMETETTPGAVDDGEIFIRRKRVRRHIM